MVNIPNSEHNTHNYKSKLTRMKLIIDIIIRKDMKIANNFLCREYSRRNVKTLETGAIFVLRKFSLLRKVAINEGTLLNNIWGLKRQ